MVALGLIIGLLILSPSTAYQISSNLQNGFKAIASGDVKAENNLVGLDAGGTLPVDVIPAEAVTTVGYVNNFCYGSSYNYPIVTCPTGYWKLQADNTNTNNSISYVNGEYYWTLRYYVCCVAQ